jgi:hypothetical protein
VGYAGTPGAYGVQVGNLGGSPYAVQGLLENVRCEGFSVAAWRFVNSQGTVAVGCSGTSSADGCLFDNVTNVANRNTAFIRCQFTDNTRRGVFIKEGSGLHFL